MVQYLLYVLYVFLAWVFLIGLLDVLVMKASVSKYWLAFESGFISVTQKWSGFEKKIKEKLFPSTLNPMSKASKDSLDFHLTALYNHHEDLLKDKSEVVLHKETIYDDHG